MATTPPDGLRRRRVTSDKAPPEARVRRKLFHARGACASDASPRSPGRKRRGSAWSSADSVGDDDAAAAGDDDDEEDDEEDEEEDEEDNSRHASPQSPAQATLLQRAKSMHVKKNDWVVEADFCLLIKVLHPSGGPPLAEAPAHTIVYITAMLLRDAGCLVTIYPLRHAEADAALATTKADTHAYLMTVGTDPDANSELPEWVRQHPAYQNVQPLAGLAHTQQLTKLIMKECIIEETMYLETGAVAFPAEKKLLQALSERKDLSIQFYPLHRDEFREQMIAKWRQNRMFQLPLLDIYQYFGPRIAMYFAWLEFYTKMLVLPSFFGLVLHALVQTQAKSYVIQAFLLSIGTSVFVDFWRRKQREIEYTWKYEEPMETHAVTDFEMRPQFKGEWMSDPVTHERVYDFPYHKRFFRQLLAVPLLLSMCCIVAGYVVALNVLSEKLRSNYRGCFHRARDHPERQILGEAFCLTISQGPGVLNALIIHILDHVYQICARQLNEYENYRTADEFEDHLVMKRMPFHFINSNASLLFLAFYVQDLGRVRDRMWILMVAMQLLDNFKEVGLPFVVSLSGNILDPARLRRRNSRIDEWASKEQASGALSPSLARTNSVYLHERVTRLLIQKRQSQYVDTFSDYKEMVIQYGYVALYSPIFPLAPVFALLNNVIESRSDFLKLVNVHGCQRPFVQHTHGIGVWEKVLVSFSVIAVIINCALVWTYEMEELLPSYSDLDRLMILVVAEHVIFVIKAFLNWAAPDLPTWIQNEKRIAALNSARQALDRARPKPRFEC